MVAKEFLWWRERERNFYGRVRESLMEMRIGLGGEKRILMVEYLIKVNH